VHYTLKNEPIIVAVCHCTHCQRTSGSAFSVNVMMRAADVDISGQVTEFEDIGESGAPVRRCFCPHCVSSLFSILSPESGLIAIKAGTLDAGAKIQPKAEFWRRSSQLWLGELPNLQSFETIRPSI
jgi:hypothetical protein